MSFIWPWLLISLLLVPASVFLYRRLERRRRRDAGRLGALGIAGGDRDSGSGRRRHVTPVLFLAGLALLLLAAARPQLVLPIPRIEGTVILAFDVSASMAAEDLEPTRMIAAKEAAKAFVEQQPNNINIGIVAFSDSGLVVQTPTDDHEVINEAIDRLQPQSGTSLSQGIFVALDASSDTPDSGQASSPRGAFAPAVIVLMTDGEDTTGADPLEAAQIAIERGVRVHTVGIGSPDGATLEIDGFNVFTQLDEIALRDISRMAEGDYYGAASAEDLLEVYDNLEPQFVVRSEKMEVTSILGGVSMIVLLIGGLMSLMWYGRMP